ncbi:MAG: TerB family tellurite resistance protein [Pseudomonadota bacterium]
MKKIWSDLKNALATTAPAAVGEEAVAHHAAAALMIEMCEADLKTEPEELEAVAAALKDVFALSEETVTALVAEARANNNAEISYYPHVETVNELCGQAEKADIVRSLWRVAAADGNVDKYEEHYLRRLCELIHVPHRVFVQTRNEVLSI